VLGLLEQLVEFQVQPSNVPFFDGYFLRSRTVR
jgi:hypothetical protein